MFTVRLIQAERLRRTLVSLFYAAYAVAMGYCFFKASTQSDRFLYGMLLLFVPFGVLYEVIRYRFVKSNDALNKECRPEQALKQLQFVTRADFLSRYRAQALYLKGFALLDQDKPEEVETLIASKLDSVLSGNRSLNFEYNYLCFTLWVIGSDSEKLQKSYTVLKKIFGLKQKPGSDLVSLEKSVDGIFHLKSGKYQAAQAAFEQVRVESLSERERARFFYYRAWLSKRQGDRIGADRFYAQAVELAPDITLFQNHRP